MLQASEAAGPGGASQDIVVVGAGIIGLASALELAERGYGVTVVDPGRRQGISSWTGGGILSPLYPWRMDPAVNQLARRSQQLFPDLCHRMQEQVGVDPELRELGMIYADFPSRAPVNKEQAREWGREQGVEVRDLDGDELVQAEPEISPVAESGLRLPGVAWIRTPRFMRGLFRLAHQAGVTLLDGTTVLNLRREDGAIRGVETDAGPVQAERVVMAAGPWSAGLLDRVGVELPVRPVKGAMLLLEGRRSVLGQLVMAGRHYLIPRADNRLLVGSTLEETGFDARTSLGAVRALAQAAVELVPETANLELETYWAGLRHARPDDRHFIGAIPGLAGLYVNTGHFRNGVVQALASAEVLAATLTGEESPVDVEPFAPDREIPDSEPG